MCDQEHVLGREVVGLAQVAGEGVEVLHLTGEGVAGMGRGRGRGEVVRMAMAARVPGEGPVLQPDQLPHQPLKLCRVAAVTMQEDQHAQRRGGGAAVGVAGLPGAVEQACLVCGGETGLATDPGVGTGSRRGIGGVWGGR